MFEDTLRIGSLDDPGTALSPVGGILATPDGGVWVLQPTEGEVLRFDQEGYPLRHVGGRGMAPGEFQSVTEMGRLGATDTVWVADRRNQSLSFFDVDGEHVRSEAMPTIHLDEALDVRAPQAMLREGDALAVARRRPGTHAEAVVSLPVVRYGPGETGSVERLAEVDRDGSVQIEWDGEPVATGEHPIPDSPIVVFSGGARRVVIADRTVSATDEGPVVRLVVLDAEGDTLWTRRFAYDPERVPDDEWNRLVGPRIEAFKEFAALEGRLTSSEAEDAYRAAVRRPEYRPPLRSVHMDDHGRVLIEWSRSPGQSGELWLLNPGGDPEARVGMDDHPEILGLAGDYIWALEVDELDVPYLVRYRTSADGM